MCDIFKSIKLKNTRLLASSSYFISLKMDEIIAAILANTAASCLGYIKNISIVIVTICE